MSFHLPETDRKIRQTLVLLGIFGIAMGFLEAVVVVYLREIYYPNGFDFPLSAISPKMISVEWLREFATITMLATLALIAGRNYPQKLACFLYSFAIWDLSYYVGLKLLLDWPQSLLTWDILFLIPMPWVGPVLAPVICSLTMIIFAGSIVGLQARCYPVRIKLPEWILIILGSIVILYTFISDYLGIILRGGFLSGYLTLPQNDRFNEVISQYEPSSYNWLLFALGEAIIVSAIIILIRRAIRDQIEAGL